MLVPAHVFREYDIRGDADKELSDDLIRAIGEGFAQALLEDAAQAKSLRVAVGRDCRLSSPRIFGALSEGLLAGGVDVIDVGMITGSHNAGHENGLKMMKGKASFFADDIRRLRDRVAVPRVTSEHAKGKLTTVDVTQAYLDRLTDGI